MQETPTSPDGRPAAPAVVGGELGGFWARSAAYIVDTFVVALISVGFSVAGDIGTAISMLIGVAYFVYFWSTTGDTMGMRLMGLRVVKEDGSALSIQTGIIRYIGYLIAAFPLAAGLWLAAFDPKKQGWHDKIAGTLVVKTKPTPAGLVIGIHGCGCLLLIVFVIAVLVLIAAAIAAMPGLTN